MGSLSIITCIGNVMIFVILAVPGYASTRYKLMTSTQIDGLSFLMMNFLWPAMILDVMSSVKISQKLIHLSLYTAGISLLVYLLSMLLAFLYTRICRMQKSLGGVMIFAMTFNNTGLIGMPFIKAVFGDEALFIASIIEVVIDILIFSIGIMLMQPRQEGKHTLDLKNLLSPTFISILIGFLIFGFQINLPEMIGKPVGYLSDANTAIAMFLVGSQFGEASLRDLLKSWKAYQVSFFRQLLIPLLLFLVLFVIMKDKSMANTVIVLMFAMPTAACTAIMARQYKNNYLVATQCVIMSTLSSAIMLPLWLLLTDIFR